MSRKQLECLGKYYNIIQEEWDEMVDESGFYAWEQEGPYGAFFTAYKSFLQETKI